MKQPFFAEAMHTLTASRWDIFRAQLFGKKAVLNDGYYQVTVYRWRGKAYLTSFEEIK